MAWRAEVLQQFRFDSATAVSPADQRSITMKFRNQQQQILAELDRQLNRLESLAPKCQAAIQTLIPTLREAVAVYAQAEVDLRLLNKK